MDYAFFCRFCHLDRLPVGMKGTRGILCVRRASFDKLSLMFGVVQDLNDKEQQ